MRRRVASPPFAGRTVVITGAAGGIGSSLARAFAARGAQLGLLDLQAPDALADELRAGGAQVLSLACDVTDAAACGAAVGSVEARWGAVDVLINNAGITHRSQVADTDAAVIRRVMDVNFHGAIHCTQAALPGIIRKRGSVVAISSVAGFAPLVGRAAYAASKHALHGFFDTLRCELRETGAHVLVVCPSFVDTGLGERALGGDGRPVERAWQTIGRRASPQDVAEAIATAVHRRQRELVVTPTARASRWLQRLTPRLYDRLMLRAQKSECAPAQAVWPDARRTRDPTAAPR